MRTAVITIGILAASVWIGSLVCLAAVSAVARRELSGSARVTLFRGIGRLYRVLGTTSLLVSIAVGVVLAWPLDEMSRTVSALFVLSGVLVIVTAAGMAQARRMTLARQRLLARPDDDALAATVRRGATRAGVLRGAIGAVTLVIVVLGAGVLDR
jgi:hypothetical protein